MTGTSLWPADSRIEMRGARARKDFLMKRMSLRTALTACTALLLTCSGAICDSPGLTGGGLNKPGSGKTSVSLSPEDQDIRDDQDALLAATTANIPEAGTSADGIHEEARLRWTIMEGSGGLKPVSTEAAAGDALATIDTFPDGDYGNVATFVPLLDSSGTVKVRVEVIRPTNRTVINEFGEASQEFENIVLATADAVIHINDLLRLELTPKFTKLPSGGKLQLRAVFQAEDTAEESPSTATSIRYDWRMTGPAGAGDLQSSSDSDTATFTAFSEAATFTISVRTTETLEDGSQRINGPASAVVQVDPKLRTVNTFGYYFARDESEDADYYNVVAWVYVPRIDNALTYTVVGQDMHDESYYGDGWSWSFTAGLSGLEVSDGEYRFGLSSASGAAGGAGDAIGWMDGRFAGMRVLVTAVVQE
jgi:hypothetical protein